MTSLPGTAASQVILLNPTHTPQARWQEICVPPRCGGCNFDLKEGELVGVVDLDGNVIRPLTYKATGFGNENENDRVAYIPCGEDCRHLRRTPACHIECLDGQIVQDDPSSLRDFIETMAYSWPPSKIERLNRESWLSRFFDEHAYDRRHFPDYDMLVQLPELFLRLQTVRYSRERWLIDQRVHNLVNITLKFWICYALFEGQQHVVSVTNEPVELLHNSDIVAVREMPCRAENVMYIAEGILGVRDIQFFTPEEAAATERAMGVFWRTMPILNETMLNCVTDGVKTRSVSWNGIFDANSIIRWSKPQPPNFKYTFCATSERCWSPRLDYLVCSSDVTGYSVCWTDSMVSIQAHRGASQNPTYYWAQIEHPSGVWLHFAMGQSEWLKEVWFMDAGTPIGLVLCFATNFGRLKIMGWRHEAASSTRRFNWMLGGTFGPTGRLWYQDSPVAIRCIAFEGQQEAVPNMSLEPPAAMSPHQHLTNQGLVMDFYSTAPLRNIVNITLCLYEREGLEHVTGLLFGYSDGGRDSVGEIRFANQMRTVEMGGRNGFWLGCHTILGGPSGPEHICFSQDVPLAVTASTGATGSESRSRSRPQVKWTKISLRGTMEWWFNTKRRRIYIDGKRVMPHKEPFGDSIR